MNTLENTLGNTVQVLNHFNKLTGIKYDQNHFEDLIEDTLATSEATIEEAKLVIEMKHEAWKDFALENVSPSVLFKMSNFMNYLFELKTSEPFLAKLSITNAGISHGDELTIDNTIGFLDNSSYSILVRTISSNGTMSKHGGAPRPILGKALKSWILRESRKDVVENRFHFRDISYVLSQREINISKI